MQTSIRPTVILLKEGTDTSQGKPALLANIAACLSVTDVLRTTLGPRGMDKLIVPSEGEGSGPRCTVTNDGATILKLLEIVHPAAKALVDVARAQDAEVGDGTTTVAVLAGELLKQAKPLIEEGLAPQAIIRAYRQASLEAIKRVKEIALRPSKGGHEIFKDGNRSLLEKCARTSLSSKVVAGYRDFFSKMVVEAVLLTHASSNEAEAEEGSSLSNGVASLSLAGASQSTDDLDDRLIGIKKAQGGSMDDSLLIKGVAFKKTFTYAGAEQQPKLILSPRIACLNVELELKAERENAEIRVNKVQDYQAVIDAEWTIIYRQLEALQQAGANVILSSLPIGDLATQWFADRGMFSAGRVSKGDLKRVAKAFGARLLSTLSDIDAGCLGTRCSKFEEVLLGTAEDRYNVFYHDEGKAEGGENAQGQQSQASPAQGGNSSSNNNNSNNNNNSLTCTLIIRGGSDQFMDEVHRSLHDAIMIVRRTLSTLYTDGLVAGGGTIEMHMAAYLRSWATNKLSGQVQQIGYSYARAFEVIPRALAENAGLDAIDVLARLRKLHAIPEAGTGAEGVGLNGWPGLDFFPQASTAKLVQLAKEHFRGTGCLATPEELMALLKRQSTTGQQDSSIKQVFATHSLSPGCPWIVDTLIRQLLEPSLIKTNAIASATEAACMILSVDMSIITKPPAEQRDFSKMAANAGMGN